MSEKVNIGDFGKLDLRVGLIKEVEEHPSADRLLVLKVDLGEEKERTIVAGLKGHYSFDELKGRKAVFVSNLEPAMLRGVESDGMIMAAVSGDKGKVVLLDVEDAEVGWRIS